MKIGILSDTHGNTARTKRAAETLRDQGVAAVFHCGDIGSQAVLIALAEAFCEAGIPVHAVVGNVDFEDYLPAGINLHGRFAEIELAGKKIAVVHGDDFSRLQQAVRGQKFDYLFTGHTHAREDRRDGRTRIINPGAIQRAARPGFAVLDLASDVLAWSDL